jgi:hypothetical protein
MVGTILNIYKRLELGGVNVGAVVTYTIIAMITIIDGDTPAAATAIGWTVDVDSRCC